jgi:hypothetical protein
MVVVLVLVVVVENSRQFEKQTSAKWKRKLNENIFTNYDSTYVHNECRLWL